MYGSISGLALALFYFLLFQLSGISFCWLVFGKEKQTVRLVLGSAFGLCAMEWFPIIPSAFLGFSYISHGIGAFFALLVTVFSIGAVSLKKNKWEKLFSAKEAAVEIGSHKFLFFILAVWLFFCYLVVHGFLFKDGAIYSSQSTFGDMNMHLGFITSIAEQGTFPPEYSILPGTKLSYPFLGDSISSSLYLLGAPLFWAYAIPMFFAAAVVFLSFYLFAYTWLKSKIKAALAWLMLFFCGGFGIVYFLGGEEGNFKRMFTAYFETPTNLTANNVRWVNIIVDILLPQRATLFGWALLIPAMFILYRAVFEKQNRYYIYAAVLFGALPMVHTHSFLFAVILCFIWLAVWIAKRRGLDKQFAMTAKVVFVAVFSFLAVFQPVLLKNGFKNSDAMVYIGIAGILLVFAAFMALLAGYVRKKGLAQLVSTWGILLGICVLLALPQLIVWTFNQTSGGDFVKGCLNWVNNDDNYLWFAVKNLGLTGIIGFFALLFAKTEDMLKFSPAILAWFAAEFIRFQPNEYDNNKLLYPAFMLLCCLGASFLVDLLSAIKRKPLRAGASVLAVFLCTVSAVLTMGREAVSQYQIYSRQAVLAAEYAESLPSTTVFLTGTRHNNEIAALGGRNIVCGSGAFLFFHGLDYRQAELDVEAMYTFPEANKELFEKYNVEYILLGEYERGDYGIDGLFFENSFERVFENNGLAIYKYNAAVW